MSAAAGKKVRGDGISPNLPAKSKMDDTRRSAARHGDVSIDSNKSVQSFGAIEALSELGDGYVLIKFDLKDSAPDAGVGAQPHPAPPPVPEREIKRLLFRYTDTLPKAAHFVSEEELHGGDASRYYLSSGPGAEVSIRTPAKVEGVSSNNQTFMDELNQQSMSAREKNLQDAVLLSSSDFSKALGISRQAVSKAIDESRMFSLDGPSGRLLYPAFFADRTYDRRSLESVCQALGDLPGPSKWQFFTTGKGSLQGKTPLEAIASGQLGQVLIAAAGFVGR